MEQENVFLPDRDLTGHAERVPMTRASRTYAPEKPQGRAMYTGRLAGPERVR